MNNVFEGLSFIDVAIKIKSIKNDLLRNYIEIGGKPLDATAKIDEDIVAEIIEMDKENKKIYPKFLADIYKGKNGVNGTDLINYMLKVYN